MRHVIQSRLVPSKDRTVTEDRCGYAFPRSPVPVLPLLRERMHPNEEGHSSPVLPGHGRLWLLWHDLCDRFHEKGHSCRDLFPLPSVLHGAAEVHRCRRPRPKVRQEIRPQSLTKREEGRRTREEGKDGRVSDCCPPCPSLLPFSLFLSSLRRLQAGGRSAWGESVGGRRAGARADRDHLRQHVQREERGAYPPSATGANRPSARPGVQSCPRRPVRCRAGGLTRRIAAGSDAASAQ